MADSSEKTDSSQNPLVPEFIARLKVYTPGKQPQDSRGIPRTIKLNTNENPYLPPIEDWVKKIDINPIRLYPDFQKTEITDFLAKTLSVSPDMIAWGNGSDELIGAIFKTFLLYRESRKVALSRFTYGAYKYYAYQYDCPIESIEMNGFEFNEDSWQQLENSVAQVFFLTNPNAPTGLFLTPDQVSKICLHNSKKVVVVDEAYIDFASESGVDVLSISAVPLIKDNPNLIVLRTFSKAASACGIRLGYAVGSNELISALKKVLDPYNVHCFAQQIGLEILKHQDRMDANNQKVIRTREQLISRLSEMNFSTLPSRANFILTRMSRQDLSEKNLAGKTKSLYQFLETNGVLVRYFDESVLDKYLRISIGTDSEVNNLLELISSFKADN